MTEPVDLRFTDLRGRWQHVTRYLPVVRPAQRRFASLNGAALEGWQSSAGSDLRLRFDDRDLADDPADPALRFAICDVVLPDRDIGYGRDPRAVLRRAEAHAAAEIGAVRVGIELEFHLFRKARFRTTPHWALLELDNPDSPESVGPAQDDPHNGLRAPYAPFHLQLPPADLSAEIRHRIAQGLIQAGIGVVHHARETGPGQNELALAPCGPAAAADRIQQAKYLARRIGQREGRAVTFMPLPLGGLPGNGLHVNLSVWRDGDNLFAGDDGVGLSPLGRWAVGGILGHIPSLSALTNGSVNGFRRLYRLLPDDLAAIAAPGSRTAAIRIPATDQPAETRIELRFPDAAGNPYLMLAGCLMAMVDGIRHRIEPPSGGAASAGAAAPAHFPDGPGPALTALAADQPYLLAGDVFNPDLLAAYIELKRREVRSLNAYPAPIEFDLYFGH